ncbi:MAG: ROK family transcriptional regulator [Veillonella sp.]|uniref:ROK family transcriptional regulator n=1 Tax=Veillonella sp. TaxID=1926307 RepID=UPI0025F24531|nr:ROK family transcriptional regulator [Veillonella sp.]MBS4913503.1 ROK family transcriptional regulator [Veillonella sp.]
MQSKQVMSNDEIILNYIRRHGSVSKAIIARNTGITPPTVTNICTVLAQKGLIYEDRQERSALGRPSMLLKFNEQKEMMLIVHVRTHKIVMYVVQAGGIILNKVETSIIGSTIDEIMNQIYRGIEEVLGDIRWSIAVIGLILRGPVDSQKGISIYSPNVKWNNIPFKYILEERFHLPTYVENDVRCLANGEYYFGSGKDIDNLLVLKFSYGLGVSLVYKGTVYRGFNDCAGEVGYTVIDMGEDQQSGEPTYTRLESVASETAIREYVLAEIKKGRESSVATNPDILANAFRVEPIYEAAVEGDALCLEALNRVGKYLGVTLANLYNIINPQRIVISSVMGNAVSTMDPILRRVLESNLRRVQAVDLVYSGNGSYYTLLGMVDIVSTRRAREVWLTER